MSVEGWGWGVRGVRENLVQRSRENHDNEDDGGVRMAKGRDDREKMRESNENERARWCEESCCLSSGCSLGGRTRMWGWLATFTDTNRESVFVFTYFDSSQPPMILHKSDQTRRNHGNASPTTTVFIWRQKVVKNVTLNHSILVLFYCSEQDEL